MKKKKTILILVANPQNTSSLSLLPEINKLQEAIQRSLNKDHFQIVWKVAVQEQDLRRHILDIKPHIVHYCGHGTKEGLILHDENQQQKLLSNEFIVDLLKEFKNRIECVILNACETEPLAELLANHLNYAVGMKLEVKDKAAVVFAEGFYDALGAGEKIPTAFNIGKNAVLGLNTVGNVTQRKAVYDGNDLQENDPIPDHLIPVIKQNPRPTEIESTWLSTAEKKAAIKALLKEIESFHNKIKLFHSSEAITITDQYIPIQVTLERRYKDKLETIGSYAEAEADLKRIYALKGSREEDTKEKKEKIVKEKIENTQENWQKAKKKQDYIIVLADPGMGKSTLLRMEVCQTVAHSLQKLNQGKELDNITIPIFMRLSSLADEEDLTIDEAIIKLVQQSYSRLLKHQENETVSQFLSAFLEQQLKAGKCLLLLDALDEVPIEKRSQLIENIDTFVKNFSCPIIATSRIVGYGGRLIDQGKEMEIIPFTQQQTEKYITTWFNNAKDQLQDSSVNAPNLIKALKERPQISGLAQNPLLLSLICSLYQEDKLNLPAKRGQIYQQAVNYMLSEWSVDNDRKRKHEADIDSKEELLTELAYEFSKKGTEVFSLRILKQKIKDYLKRDNATNLDKEANRLITELSEKDGILQKLNPDKSEYLFLHRTFQEYFTALYLKYQIEDDEETGIKLVKQYFWDYDWHETIALLAGLLKKPMLLIEAIGNEKDDIFKTQLMLAGRCVGECYELKYLMVEKIVKEVFELFERYPQIELFKTILSEIGRDYDKVLEGFLSTLNDEDSDVRRMAAEEVLVKIGSDKVVEGLLSTFNDEYIYDIFPVVEALVNIGSDKAVEGFLSALNNRYSYVRWMDVIDILADISSCVSYGVLDELVSNLSNQDIDVRRMAEELFVVDIGSDKAVEVLLSKLHHENSFVRKYAAELLVKIGSEKVVEKLVSNLNDKDIDVRRIAAKLLTEICSDKDLWGFARFRFKCHHDNSDVRWGLLSPFNYKDSDVRGMAAKALGEIGSDKAVEGLLSPFNYKDSDVRGIVAKSLAEIYSDKAKAVEGFLSTLNDEDSDVRGMAAKALGEIGSDKAVEGLLSTLNDKDSDVRRMAAESLGEIGSDKAKAVEVLLSTLNDENSFVRGMAAKALAEICSDKAKAVEVLVSNLNDENSFVRKYAAKALGEIGSDKAKAVEGLLSTLNDKDSDVGRMAAEALGEIGRDKAVEGLLSALNDQDRSVRKSAAEALEKIGSLTVLEAFIRSPNINIYDDYIFPLARRLAIKHSKSGSSFIPVYPELVETATSTD